MFHKYSHRITMYFYAQNSNQIQFLLSWVQFKIQFEMSNHEIDSTHDSAFLNLVNFELN